MSAAVYMADYLTAFSRYELILHTSAGAITDISSHPFSHKFETSELVQLSIWEVAGSNSNWTSTVLNDRAP
jgi:hypothetical protein